MSSPPPGDLDEAPSPATSNAGGAGAVAAVAAAPGPSDLPAFSDPQNDVVLVSADGRSFSFRRLYLEAASEVFEDMFAAGGAEEQKAEDGRDLVRLPDDAPCSRRDSSSSTRGTRIRSRGPREGLCDLADKYAARGSLLAILAQGERFLPKWAPLLLVLAIMHQPRDLAAAALKSFGRSPDFTLNNFSFRLFSRLDAKAAYLLQQEQIRILDPRSKRNTWDVMAKRLSQPPASHTIDSWPAVDPSAGLLVYPGNDVVVRASDGVEFSFRKMYLSSASPELEKTLSDDPTLEKLNIPAEASVVEFFLQHVSPRQACPKISSFSISEECLWSLCKKYGTSGVLSFVLSQSTQFAKDYALSLLALAIVHDQPRVAYDALPEFDDKFQFLWDEDDGYNKFARPRFTLSDIPLRLLKQLPLVAVYALQRYQQWLYNPRNGRPKSWHGMRMKLQREPALLRSDEDAVEAWLSSLGP